MTNTKKSGGVLLMMLLFCLGLLMAYLVVGAGKAQQPAFSEVVSLFEQEKVAAFELKDGTLKMDVRMDDGSISVVRREMADYQLFYDQLGALVREQAASGVILSYEYPTGDETNYLAAFLPYVLVIAAAIAMWYFLSARGNTSGGDDRMAKFGLARVRGAGDLKTPVTFADVAGADEEKEELREVVEFLRDPERFLALGARIPKGILLVGPPGTGKTLLAKAVAGEAGVGFLSISGSDFMEMYVGVGASRVRDLFEQAKKAAPAIVFIDEIDAVGRQRGTGLGGGHDEREQTLNQLLVEMDGFGSNVGVVVLAATNRADILDPALTRPGRFDRRVYVGYPDIRGREAILKIHTAQKPLAEDVSLAEVAQATGGFTGADLENLCNEAALLAARRGEKMLTMSDFHEAELKVIAGPEKRSRVVSPHERRLTAYHEAGHAVVIAQLPTHDPVHQISIIPRGEAGGMTVSLPQEDRSYQSRRSMEEQIVSLLGGRVAEKLMLDDISTGASNDLQRATALARRMVTVYGMSEKLGALSLDNGQDEVFLGRSMGHSRGYSEQTAAVVDGEVKSIVDAAFARCEAILTEKRAALTAVAEYLLAHETMSAAEFARVLEENRE